jgi:hypothetical protein
MIREHAEKKAAGETGRKAVVDRESKAAPIIDAEAKKEEKRIAFRELKTFRRRNPTLNSARESRLKAMAALNLNSPPRYDLFHLLEVSSAYPGAVDSQCESDNTISKGSKAESASANRTMTTSRSHWNDYNIFLKVPRMQASVPSTYIYVLCNLQHNY